MGDCVRMGGSPLRIRTATLLPLAVAMPGFSSADTAIQLLPVIPDTSVQWVLRRSTGDMDRRGTGDTARDSSSYSVFTEAE